MAHRATTRTVAGGAATALALGALTIFGTSVATAAPQTITWDNGASHYTRTISNTTPGIGDTITVSTKLERTNSTDEKLNWFKDWHPACLTYIPSTAKVTLNSGDRPVEPYLQIASDFIAGDFAATSYQVIAKNHPGDVQSPVFTAQYTVGANCTLGTAMNTGIEYGTNLGSADFKTKGPSITATKANTATTLAPVTGAKVGTATTLTATVTGAATGNTVEFYDGTTKIGQNTVGANGTATYQWTPTTAGQHTLTAKFPGTATANASQSAPQTTTVAAAAVTSTITLAPVTGAKVGTVTTLTATVNPAAAGGTVTFKDDEYDMDTVQVGANGSVTYEWTPGWDDQHTITATFSGRDGVLGSTTTQQVSVTAADVDSTTTLAPVPGAKEGTATTLTATVNPAAAGGTIEFKDGDTVLGTAQVGANGEATHQWTPTATGQRTITATFSGRNGVTGSTTTQQITVAPADVASTTTLNPVTGAKEGTAITLTATVNPAAAGGTIEFKDGDTVLGTAQVGANGEATHQWTPTAAGNHAITATFSGHDNVLGSTTTQQVSVTAADVASTTTLAPVTGAKEGTATTLTATVNPAAAGGTIEFKDGDTVLGTAQVAANGEATHQWTPTAAGQRTITATFSGHDNVLGSTTTQQVTVTAANSNSTVTITPVTGAKVGTAITLTATVNPAAAGGTVTFKDGTTVLGTGQVAANGKATYQWTPTTTGQRTITADFSGHGTTNASTTHTTVTVAPSGGTNPGGNGSLGSLSGGFGSSN